MTEPENSLRRRIRGLGIEQMRTAITQAIEAFELFEELGSTPVCGLPLKPSICKARLWTRDEVSMLIAAYVAVIEGTTFYVMKVFDNDIESYVHRLVTKNELMTTLNHFSFQAVPNEDGTSNKNIEARDVIPNIPMYTKIVFDPGCPDPRTRMRRPRNTDPMFRAFNIYKGIGFTFDPHFQVQDQAIDMFRSHALQVLCDNNSTLFAYLEMWLAHLFQYPDKKPGTALCFISDQGAGKNVFWQVIMDIITPLYCAYIIQKDHLQGKFNNHLANKLFVLCDEVTWGGSHETNSLMKARITQTDMMLEKKGCDPYNIKCFERYVVLSNETWPVKVEESDRRWAVFQVSGCKIGDREYFNRFAQSHKDNDVLRAIYHYYMNLRDVPPFMPLPPESDAKDALKDISRADESQFLVDLMDHANGCEDMTFARVGARVSTNGLYDLYLRWAGANGLGKNHVRLLSQRLFAINVARVLGKATTARHDAIVKWPGAPLLSGSTGVAKAYTLARKFS